MAREFRFGLNKSPSRSRNSCRECLDHVIVLNQAHLHRLLESYFAYYHRSRTHLALDKDAPQARPIQGPGKGKIVAFDEAGGLHHRYERLAA